MTEQTPMTEQTWPTWALQRWDWYIEAWETRSTYTGARGEGNAHFAVETEHASRTGPIRLLRDGAVVLADDPATYYDD